MLALVDALERADIRFLLAKHENAAGFMAEGLWHATGAQPVLIATLGPGVANAVNVVANAEAVVGFLKSAPGVVDVRWPGFSGMVSFRHPDAIGIAQRTKLFTLAESLGGVESLIEVPQAMTHQSVEGSDAAVPADLVRLSCGVEAPEDLVADLHAAIGAGA